MSGPYRSRLAATGRLALLVAIGICAASCSTKQAQPPAMDMTNMQQSPSAGGSCQIDAIKLCQATGSSAAVAPAASTQPSPMSSSYGPPNMPDAVEFQIPLGQTIKLMCYYDPPHTSIYRADANPESPLTGNSVEYMQKQGFCTNK